MTCSATFVNIDWHILKGRVYQGCDGIHTTPPLLPLSAGLLPFRFMLHHNPVRFWAAEGPVVVSAVVYRRLFHAAMRFGSSSSWVVYSAIEARKREHVSHCLIDTMCWQNKATPSAAVRCRRGVHDPLGHGACRPHGGRSGGGVNVPAGMAPL